jgi:hypothetical protein
VSRRREVSYGLDCKPPGPAQLELFGPPAPLPPNAIHVGYTHASIIRILRPDVAYPDRKVAASSAALGTTTSQPCQCPDEHVAVYVLPMPQEAP